MTLALQLTRDKQDAEDLYQKVFMKAYKAIGSFRLESEFFTWLYRITVNSFYNLRWKASRIQQQESLVPEKDSTHDIADDSIPSAANDELIANLLFYLLLHDQNPGKRLKAVKLLQNSQPAQETKMVLVSALLTDSNPGIRLKSIRLLSTYEPGKIILDACMKVLLEDENEAVRLSAMDIMEMAPDVSMIPALQVVSVLDENDFIRDRAQELLRIFSSDETDSRVEVES